MKKLKFTSVIFLAFLGLIVNSSEASPYGVCAHVERSPEHKVAVKEFKLMRKIGIRWVRTDFSWSGICKKKGHWDFTKLDETVRWAEENGIKLLPILDYDVPWASPAHKNLKQWGEYVQKVVSRYQDKIKYWEVYNEPNVSLFWRGTPSAVEYTKLLIASSKIIKKINPELKVVMGGVVWFPWDFIKEIYKNGGGAHFDVMNIHPYTFPLSLEKRSISKKISYLRKIMDKNGDKSKPIWITEIGWSTVNRFKFASGIIKSGLQALTKGKQNLNIAIMSDPSYGEEIKELDFNMILPQKGKITAVDINSLSTISPEKYDALLMPPLEDFPIKSFKYLKKYIKEGGIIIFWCGVPMYYSLEKKSDNTWQRKKASGRFRRELRIGWEAWWQNKQVPKKARKLKSVEKYKDIIKFPDTKAKTHVAQRFINSSLLHKGDKFIPIIYASTDSYTGVAAAAIKFNSDFKGGLIISTFWHSVGITEKQQAKLLPRAFLLSFQNNIQKIFWYEFQALDQKDAHANNYFGITHQDLSPKPAYHSYNALTKMCPAGSKPGKGKWRNGSIFYPHWKRLDGKNVWAIWSTTPKTIKLKLFGNLDESYDYMGQKINISKKDNNIEIKATEEVIYLLGPEKITFPF